jgi:NADPH:quinone reductase-like Zn-dependent oxidoreductase
MTATMRAAIVRAHGGLDAVRIESVPVPEPGPGEVRVALRAIGINHLDLWVRRGVPGHRFPLPLILGSDGAGVVDRCGAGVRGIEPGAEVVLLPGVSGGTSPADLRGEDQLAPDYGILGESRDGCCAEFVVVPRANVAPKPRRLSFPEAAAMPLAFQTAWSMLVRKARLQPGETLLVQAAGSGVGSAAVQIGKLLGARVLATAGGPAKCERARALGADLVIDTHAQDFVEEVRRQTGKRGVAVVFEHVGGATFTGSLRCLERGGRLVTCGATAGAEVALNLRLLFFKNLQILGNTMGSKGDLLTVLELAEQGRLRPVVDQVLPLAQIAEAHRRIESRQVFGKIVLEP